MSRRRRNYRTVCKEVEVEVSLGDFDDDDILEEAQERGVGVPFEMKAKVERLYYATRGGDPLTPELQSQVRELLQDLYGRAA